MITADVSTSKHATNFARTRKYSLTKTKNQSQKKKSKFYREYLCPVVDIKNRYCKTMRI